MKGLLLTVPLAAAMTASASAQVSADTGVQFKIRNYNSGLVLGIDSASQNAGAHSLQWTDSDCQDQLWHFVPEGNGQYLIENMNSHQVLGIAGASQSPGALALQWADNGRQIICGKYSTPATVSTS